MENNKVGKNIGKITHPSTLQEKKGLCSPKLQPLPILHFVLLPIFNYYTFFAIQLPVTSSLEEIAHAD